MTNTTIKKIEKVIKPIAEDKFMEFFIVGDIAYMIGIDSDGQYFEETYTVINSRTATKVLTEWVNSIINKYDFEPVETTIVKIPAHPFYGYRDEYITINIPMDMPNRKECFYKLCNGFQHVNKYSNLTEYSIIHHVASVNSDLYFKYGSIMTNWESNYDNRNKVVKCYKV